jgi:uncharacterized protein
MEIFIIPRKDTSDEYIVYAPLQNVAFFCNQNAKVIVEKYTQGIELSTAEKETVVWNHLEQIEKIQYDLPEPKIVGSNNCVVIILSQLCNLSCSYCYAREARSKMVLNKTMLKTVIDHILLKSPTCADFVFIGGGEPLVTWNVLKWSIEYIFKVKDESTHVNITITTNATLLTCEKIDFLKKYNIQLGLSFDILPIIQNKQRVIAGSKSASFDIVNAVIKQLDEAGISYSFRSTITKLNVRLMPEMVNFVLENYKCVTKLHFEPVSSVDDNDETFYQEFVDSFMKARTIGMGNGITVYNSITTSLDKINSRFCRGEFCVTPTGAIVACHRISSEKEDLFESFNYGLVKEEISIDIDKRNDVFELFNAKQDSCSTCFAKWHCAGGCPTERLIQTHAQHSFKCQFVKDLIVRLLEERLSSKLYDK